MSKFIPSLGREGRSFKHKNGLMIIDNHDLLIRHTCHSPEFIVHECCQTLTKLKFRYLRQMLSMLIKRAMFISD